jgi:regulator of sirC expression with transglutaminase-like and TPR domain
VRELIAILTGPMPMGRLDRAALELATLEYPDLNIDIWLDALDRHAEEIGRRVPANAAGGDFIDAANRYLFEEQQFTGNQANYYDPRNSCLNDVLALRTGIPITLSVVYMEVARRLSRPVYGVGLPGHFIVQYDDGMVSEYLDPFHGGARLSAGACFQLAREATGTDIPADASLLAPVTHRQILERMVNNLRGVYFSRQNFPKALRILDFTLQVHPGSTEDYKQRGLVHAGLGNTRAALSDLERYLALATGAADRGEIENHIRSLRRYLAGLN